nr:hypothetical protein [Tanacetum cinerariifolium]
MTLSKLNTPGAKLQEQRTITAANNPNQTLPNSQTHPLCHGGVGGHGGGDGGNGVEVAAVVFGGVGGSVVLWFGGLGVGGGGDDGNGVVMLMVGVVFGGGSSSAWGCCGDGGGVVVDGSRVTAASEGE